MKIEQLIVQHLYSNKKVTLQDIGTFTLSPDAVISFENDKDVALPENSISFDYNKRAPQDDSLVDFIVEHTNKIKPLATSDLESYTILGKQFLNIGKPFILEGLGTLIKNQQGNYEFTQGQFIHERLTSTHGPLKEKDEEKISFKTPIKENDNRKIIILAIAGFAILIVAASLFYFLRKDKKEQPVNLVNTVMPDTTKHKKDSIAAHSVMHTDSTTAKHDSSTFKIVVREYTSRAFAEKLQAKFAGFGHKLTLYAKDSTLFKLAVPFTSPLSDSTHKKDSLHILFGGKTYVEVD